MDRFLYIASLAFQLTCSVFCGSSTALAMLAVHEHKEDPLGYSGKGMSRMSDKTITGSGSLFLTRTTVPEIVSEFSRLTLEEKKQIGRYIMDVADSKRCERVSWEKMPLKQDEDIDGLNEDYILAAYEAMYATFIDKYLKTKAEEDLDNAARALAYGSRVSENKGSLFYMLLDSLGIKGVDPEVIYIKEILEKTTQGHPRD
jgi:hypothetical protein